MMTAEGANSPSIMGTAKELMKHQGIGGFYCGIDANVMRAMVLNGTKWHATTKRRDRSFSTQA